MRTIRFRGKRLLDNKFVYGSLVQCLDGSVGIFNGDDFEHNKIVAVKKSTIGQFTGLTDKNGKAIYEGDILGCDRPNIRHLVFYCEKEARFKAALNGETKMSILGICGLDDRRWIATKEVIGNIHDNPEMLEKGGEQ